jgi:autotransporter-associated beta strand protein
VWDNGLTANWFDGTSDVVWDASGGSSAVFGGAAGGLVTIDTSSSGGTGIVASGLIFNTAGYTIVGLAPTDVITLLGTNGVVVNQNAAINTTLAGTSGLAVTGTGVLQLGAAAAYSGNTTIGFGATLQATAANVFAVNSAHVVSGTLSLNGNNQVIGSVAGSGSLSLDTAVLTTGGDNSSTIFSGLITGSGGLIKSGTGTLSLTGVNIGYSGTTLIGAGTLQVGNGNAIGSGALTIGPGGTLDLNNQALANAVIVSGAGAAGNGAIINSNVVGATQGLTNVTLSGDTTFGGAGRWDIRGTTNDAATLLTTGGSWNLTKTGTNLIALANINTDAGLKTVTINSGQMGLEGAIGDGNLGDPTANLVINPGATFYLFNLGPTFKKQVVLQGGTFQALSGSDTAVGSVTLNANSTIDTPTALTLTGALSGTASITKTGGNTLTLSAANNNATFTGGETVTAGTLSATAVNALGAGLLTVGTSTVGATVNLNNNSQTIGNVAGASAGTIAIGTAVLTLTDSTDQTYGGVLTGTGQIVKNGAGILTLSGTSNTFSGTAFVNAGTLRPGAANALLGSGVINVGAAGTLSMNGFNASAGALAGGGLVSLGTNTLTIGGNNVSTTFSGTATGTGTIVKTGTNSLWTLGAANALSSTGSLTLSSGTVALGANSQTINNISGTTLNNGTNGFITLDLGSATLTVSGGSVGSVIAGAGGGKIVMSGTGALTIGGATNTFNGGIAVNSGTLQSALGGGIPQGFLNGAFGTGPLTLAGGKLSLQLGGGSGFTAARVSGSNDTTTPNPNTHFAVGTVEGQDTTANNGTTTGDLSLGWKDQTTWIYSGQFFFAGNTNNNSVTVGKSFDDGIVVKIDNQVVLNNQTFGANPVPIGTISGLTPGTWHTIEVRLGQGTGGVGPRSTEGWNGSMGFGIDLQGRGQTTQANFVLPAGTNVGSLIQLNANAPVVNYGNSLIVNNTSTIDLSNGALLANFGAMTVASGANLTVQGTNVPLIVPAFAATNGTTLNNSAFTLTGNANLRTGNLSVPNAGSTITVNSTGSSAINGFSGLFVDGAGSTLGNISSVAVTQGVFGGIGQNGSNPLATLAVPINVNGTLSAAGFASVGPAGSTFNTPIVFNAAGQIQHTGLNADTYNGLITPNGNAINLNVLSGTLNVASTSVAGVTISKSGPGILQITGTNAITPFAINNGLVRLSGGAAFSSAATLSGGGLVIDGVPGTNAGLLTQIYTGAIGGFNLGGNNQTILYFPQNVGLQQAMLNSTAANSTSTGYAATVGTTLNFDNFNGASTSSTFTSLGYTNATNYQARFVGYFDTGTTGAGIYNFGTRSDDGSILYVDGQRLADNNFGQGLTTRSGTIQLSAGKHELMVLYYQNGGGNGLDIMMIAPNTNTGGFGGAFANSTNDVALDIPMSRLTASTTNVLSIGQDVIVSGSSTLATTAALIANDTAKLTLNPGSFLTVQGAATRFNNVVFNGVGTYGFAASTNSAVNQDISLGSISGVPLAGVTIVLNTSTNSTGGLVVDTAPSATNGAGALTYQATSGNLIIFGSNGAANPLGNVSNTANVLVNGGNLLLTSKGGNVTYDNPITVGAVPNSGTSAIVATQTWSGFGSGNIANVTDVATSTTNAITITIGGSSPLTVAAGGSATIGSTGNWTLQVGGPVLGTNGGQLIVNEGVVALASPSGTGNFNGSWLVSNVGATFGATGGLGIFGTNQGLLSINSSNQVNAGNVTVLGGMARVNVTNGFSGTGALVTTSNGSNMGVVQTLIPNFIPTISTNSTAGVIAIDAPFTNTINMAAIGNGGLFLSSANGTSMTTSVLPGGGNVYRFLANAYNQNNLFINSNLADGTAATSMQIGVPNTNFRVNNGGAGSGSVTLLGTNTFTGGVTVSAGALVITTNSSIGSGPLNFQSTTLDAINFGSNNIYVPLSFSNTINVTGNSGLTTGALTFWTPTTLTGPLSEPAGFNLTLSGLNTTVSGFLTQKPTVNANLGNVTLGNNLIYAPGSTSALPGQNFNDANGSILLFDSSGSNAITFQQFLANRTGGFNTNLSTVATWQMGTSGAIAARGAGETIIFNTAGSLGTRPGGVNLTATNFFDINFQIGSERIINNQFVANAPITFAQPTLLTSTSQGGTTRRSITIGNSGPGLIGASNFGVVQRFTGGFGDGTSAGTLEIRSTINAPNESYIAEMVFAGTNRNTWSGNMVRDADGGGNFDPFNAGPGGLFVFAASGNTEATPGDVFVRFDDNQINPNNVNGIGNKLFTTMPSGNNGNLSWLAALAYDQGARVLSGYRHGYMITGGGTNNESYQLPSGYQFIFGQVGGNQITGAGTLGSTGGLATLQGSTVDIVASAGSQATTLDLLVRDGQLTLGAAGATNAVLFRDLLISGVNNNDTDHGIAGAAEKYGIATNTTGTPMNDALQAVAIRTLAKRGPGTLVLNNFDFINASEVVGGTNSTLFQWQLGGGSQTALWDGGVMRETNTNSANSSLVGNFRVLFAGGVLALDNNNGNFNRNIGTNIGQVNLSGVGGGGWAAYGAPRTVTFGNSATATFSGTALNTGTVGTSQAITGMFANLQPVILGSLDSDNSITITNSFNLNGQIQNFQVVAGLNNAPNFLSGTLTNGGIAVGPAHTPTAPAAGAVGLVGAPAGTLVLSNTGNTYSSLTIVSGATVKAGVAGALSPNSLIVVNKDGVADLNGSTAIGGVAGAGTIANSGASVPLTLNMASNGVFLGSLATNITSLNKGGQGVLVISNTALNYAGPTSINGGVIRLETASAPTDAGVAYDFNGSNISGATITNIGSQGAAKNGVLFNGAGISLGTGPRGNNALLLNNPGGANEYLSVTLGTNNKGFNLNPTGATGAATNQIGWTTNAWFNGIELPNLARTLFHGNGAGDAQTIVIGSFGTAGNFQLGEFDDVGGGGFRNAQYDMTSLASGWHMITTVGNSNGATTNYYIDGNYVATADRKSISDIFTVGSFNGAAQQFANQIADVSMYNRTLSTGEITALYRSGLGLGAAPASGNLLPTNALSISNGMLALQGVNQSVASLSGAAFTKLSLANGAAFTTGAGAAATAFGGDVFGTGSLTQSGGGTTTLSGNNTFSGGLTIGANSTIVAGSTNALGSGLVTINGGKLGFVAGTTIGTSVAGFGGAGTGWQFNGTASAAANVLTICNNVTNTGGSAFFLTPQSVTNGFTASFTYTAAGNRIADGAAFVVQNSTATALGGFGGSLGYAGIGNSLAIELNLFPQNTIGTRFGSNGATGGPYLNTDPVNVANGDAIKITVEYGGGTTIAETLLDTVTGQSFFTSYAIGAPLAAILNGNNAFIGFTGATGGSAATHQIGSFVFSNAVTAYNSVSYGNSIVLGASSTFEPAANLTATLSGPISGAGALVTGTNGGTLVLANAANSYLGGTILNSGVLSISADGNLGVATSGVTINAATLLTTANLTTARNIILGSASSTINAGGNADSFSGVLSGPGALNTGTSGGTITLLNTNTYTGGSILNSGILSISADANLGAATSGVAINNATLLTTAGVTSSRPITVNSLASRIDAGGNTTTLNGTISGTGGLSTGASGGTLILGGAGTYSGPTSVNSGTLRAAADHVFSANSAYTVASGALLDLNNFNETIGSLAGSGTVVGLGTLVTGGNNLSTTFSGVITDPPGSGLDKVGSGTFTLSGINTYSGTTTIDGGVLSISSDANLGGAASTLTINAATLLTTADMLISRSIVLGSASSTIDAGGHTDVLSGVLSGSGALNTGTSGGTIFLLNANTYTGGTFINSGTVALGPAASLTTSGVTLGGPSTVFDVSALGTYSFAASQTLSGIGTVNVGAGATNILTVNGSLTPGRPATLGTLNVTGSLTLAGTSTFRLGTPGTSHAAAGLSDRVAASGDLILGGSAILLDNAGANGQGAYGPGTYKIASYGGIASGAFSSTTIPGSLHTGLAIDPVNNGVFLDAYNYAAAGTFATTINFGSVHIGDPVTSPLLISNTAAPGPYAEGLAAGFGSPTGITATGSISNLAAGSSDNTSMSVGISTAAVGPQSGGVAVNFTSVNPSLGNTPLAGTFVTASGTVYAYAAPGTFATPINFGSVHVGDIASSSLLISNTAAPSPYTEGLAAAFGTPTGLTASGSIANLAAGTSDNTSMTVALITTTPGAQNGTVAVNYTSKAVAGSGLSDTPLGSATASVTGAVYAYAAPGTFATTLNLGSFHVGDTAAATLPISNNAIGGAFAEGLAAGFGTPTGVTATGSIANLVAGSADSTSMNLSFSTVAAGAQNGTVAVNYTSKAVAGSGLSDTPLPGVVINASAAVYAYAAPGTVPASIDLGNVHVGGTASAATLTISNITPAGAFSEGLAAGFGAAPGGISATGSIANLAAGSSDNSSLALSLVTTTAGAQGGTVAVNYTSKAVAGSGLSDSPLPGATITLTGNVYSGQGIWAASGGGAWATFNNWSMPGGVPGVDGALSANDTATFANSIGSTSAVVTLPAAGVQLAGLTFANSAGGSYTLAGPGALHLNAGSNVAGVSGAAGNHSISAQVILDSNTQVSIASGNTLTATGDISGAGKSLTVSGPGTLAFTGGLTASAVTLNSAATLNMNGGALHGGTVDSAGGQFNATGSMDGIVTFVPDARVNVTGPLSVNGTLNNAGFYGPGSLVVNAGSALTAFGFVTLPTVSNAGTITADAGNLTILANTFSNTGLLANNTGASLFIRATNLAHTGSILSNSMGAVSFDQPIANAAGQSITLAGGAVGAPEITNNGVISGFGQLNAPTVVNNNAANLIGPTQIVGNLTNNPSGTVTITNAQLLITGDTVNDGLMKSFGQRITFNGSYSGSGTYNSDPADNYFLGSVNVASGGKILGGIGDNFVMSATYSNAGTYANAGGTLNGHDVVNTGQFNQTAGQATINNLSGNGSAIVGGAGTALVSVASLSQSSVTVNSGGNLVLRSAAQRLTNSAVNLQINGTGNLDLNNHELLTSTAPATIKSYLANAYDPAGNADWSKTGLTSSLAKANPVSYSVGYAYGGDLSAQDAGVTLHGGGTLGATQTLTRSVLSGDANMDGTVDFFDITQILGYRYDAGGSDAAYTDGDLNYDGKVDFFDITVVLSANYNTGQVFGPSRAAAAAVAAAGPTRAAAPAGISVAAASTSSSTLSGSGHTASSASSAIAQATTIGTPGDGKPDFEYNPATGDLKFRTDGGVFTTTGGTSSFVSSLTISSASGILIPSGATGPFANGTGATLTANLLSSALTNTPGFSDGFDIGLVLAPGLDPATLTADLSVKYQSLNGGALKIADITVPEPASLGLMGLAAAGLMARRRRRR